MTMIRRNEQLHCVCGLDNVASAFVT